MGEQLSEASTGNRAQQYKVPQAASNQPRQPRPQSPPTQQRQPRSQKPHLALEMDESPSTSSYANSYGTTGISRESIRKGFIRKVLAILMLELAVSAVAIGLTFTENTGIREFMIEKKAALWVAVIVALVTIIVLACKRDAVSKVPINYILTALFTLAMAYILGVIAAFTESDIVVFAGGFTVAVVFATTIYAVYTKTDLSKKGFFVSGLCMMALMVLIFCLCFRSRFLSVVYSGLIGILYTFFLAYDIQRLVGKYESEYSMDEYIIASIDLYIDIVKIFLVILMTRKSTS